MLRGHPSHLLLFIFITSCWYFSRTFLPDRMLLRQKLSFWLQSMTSAMSSASILSLQIIKSFKIAILAGANATFLAILQARIACAGSALYLLLSDDFADNKTFVILAVLSFQISQDVPSPRDATRNLKNLKRDLSRGVTRRFASPPNAVQSAKVGFRHRSKLFSS